MCLVARFPEYNVADKKTSRTTGLSGEERLRWETGFQRWREPGEMGKNFATLHNILQQKKHKEAGTKYNRRGRNWEYRVREEGRSDPPVSPIPHNKEKSYRRKGDDGTVWL